MSDTCAATPPCDLLPALHAALLASHSATEVLERFFGAPVMALRLPGAPLPPTQEQRGRLLLATSEPWAHRRVALSSRGRTLSHADLWYVPGRLDAAMVEALETTDRPFGHVVRPLMPHRTTLSACLSEAGSSEAVGLEHRALLTVAAGAGRLPIAEVHERYCIGGLGGPIVS
jgi:chorismate-pyruvate lyase